MRLGPAYTWHAYIVPPCPLCNCTRTSLTSTLAPLPRTAGSRLHAAQRQCPSVKIHGFIGVDPSLPTAAAAPPFMTTFSAILLLFRTVRHNFPLRNVQRSPRTACPTHMHMTQPCPTYDTPSQRGLMLLQAEKCWQKLRCGVVPATLQAKRGVGPMPDDVSTSSIHCSISTISLPRGRCSCTCCCRCHCHRCCCCCCLCTHSFTEGAAQHWNSFPQADPFFCCCAPLAPLPAPTPTTPPVSTV